MTQSQNSALPSEDVSASRWLPLGIDSEGAVAKYDALHDGVPEWMSAAFWAWIRESLTTIGRYTDGSGSFPILDTKLAENLCQTLQIPAPSLRHNRDWDSGGRALALALKTVTSHSQPLQIADYLLAHDGHANAAELDSLLQRSKSLYQVGRRHGRPGLTRRVPLGVKENADALFARSAQAGVRLAKAWEALYGLNPDSSKSYSLAIKAVEDAAVPVVCPTNPRATLGTLISQMADQGNWSLPLHREQSNALSSDILLGMMRLLWNGQHDRHGGQPSAPGDVSFEEAQVGVSLAVNIVQLFAAGTVQRRQPREG